MKQLKTFLVAAFLGTVAMHSTAQTVIAGGYCGTQVYNLTWTLYSDSTFVISGSGDMEDYDNMWYPPPWFFSYGDKIKTVIIGNDVTSIGRAAFEFGTNLTSVTIGNGVITIGETAFYNNKKLIHVIIGNSITKVNRGAFYSCTNLATLSIHAVNPPILGNDVFSVSNTIPIYVPCGSVPAYQDSVGWSYFTNYHTLNTDSTFYNATICYNILYTDNNFVDLTQAGIYHTALTNSIGCDSIICLTLAEYPQIPITNYSASICQNDIYSDDNFTDLTLAGTYYDTLQNSSGCDSIIELVLIINPTYITQINDSICIGDSYDFFGKLLIASGIYYDTLHTIHSCDSIIELTLVVTSVGIAEFADSDIQITSYEIYDVLGKLLLSQQSSLSFYFGLLHFVRNDVEEVFSQLPSGIYFIRMQTNNGLITKKLIKL